MKAATERLCSDESRLFFYSITNLLQVKCGGAQLPSGACDIRVAFSQVSRVQSVRSWCGGYELYGCLNSVLDINNIMKPAFLQTRG
jgi:hypothetical protein